MVKCYESIQAPRVSNNNSMAYGHYRLLDLWIYTLISANQSESAAMWAANFRLLKAPNTNS